MSHCPRFPPKVRYVASQLATSHANIHQRAADLVDALMEMAVQIEWERLQEVES